MSLAPRTLNEALQYAQAESASRSQDWRLWCQMFVRKAWGLPPLFGSAIANWEGADDEDRHEGGVPSDAPVGAGLYFKGSSPFGHAALAARPFRDGTPALWSTDIARVGHVDKAARTAPITAWGQRYLGYLTAVNGFDLPIGGVNRPVVEPEEPEVPREKQPRRYLSIGRAGDRLAVALATAKRRGDKDDVEVLSRELRRLRRLYDTLERERSN